MVMTLDGEDFSSLSSLVSGEYFQQFKFLDEDWEKL